MVKSEQAYNPQNYVATITGQYYIFRSDNIDKLVEEIESCLKKNDFDCLWNYPLSEIDHIVENKLNVVLVELTGDDEDGEWKTVYRWFEVPEDFTEGSPDES